MTGRVLAIDFGARRVGLAISDRSRTLARPLETIAVTADAEAVDRIARRIDELAAEEDGVGTIVVGLPARLDGSASNATSAVLQFVARLKQRTAVPVVTEDERLSSREAESRLAENEPDWRRRKARLDAAAAAVFLQDYLDRLI
ncbi:MAG: Holliday junction resolvase RuvX [Acidobacteria bacterium]|nr:Holliday junction resolvase RuvX [Acidobacteriota bacterium]